MGRGVVKGLRRCAGVGVKLFGVIAEGRGKVVFYRLWGDGLTGKDQTLTTSPVAPARRRGLTPPPPR